MVIATALRFHLSHGLSSLAASLQPVSVLSSMRLPSLACGGRPVQTPWHPSSAAHTAAPSPHKTSSTSLQPAISTSQPSAWQPSNAVSLFGAAPRCPGSRQGAHHAQYIICHSANISTSAHTDAAAPGTTKSSKAATKKRGSGSSSPTPPPAPSTSPDTAPSSTSTDGPTRVVVLAVDPDTHGAVAATCWDTDDLGQVIDVQHVHVDVYDMPCVAVDLKQRNKRTGEHKQRRWVSIEHMKQLIRHIVDTFTLDVPASTGSHAASNSHNGHHQLHHNDHDDHQQATQGKSTVDAECSEHAEHGEDGEEVSGGGGGGGADSSQWDSSQCVQKLAGRRLELRAFVESTPIMPHSSRLATLATQVHSVGAWHGMLSMAGFKTCTVPASLWKKELGLTGMGKPGSVALAQQLWPDTAHIMQRKKDHGRAEAMLILAWGLGTRRPPPTVWLQAQSRARAAARAAKSHSAGLLGQRSPSPPAASTGAATGGSGLAISAEVSKAAPEQGVMKKLLLARAGVTSHNAVEGDHVQHVSGGGSQGLQAVLELPMGGGHDDGAQEGDGGEGAAPSHGNGHANGNGSHMQDDTPPHTSSHQSQEAIAVEESGDESGGEELSQQAGDADVSRAQPAVISEADDIQIRSQWPIISGSLRPYVATDGYGNPLPASSLQETEQGVMPVTQAEAAAATSPAAKRSRAKSTKRKSPSGSVTLDTLDSDTLDMTHGDAASPPPPVAKPTSKGLKLKQR